MPNMLDYIAWRGDLTVDQSPLCECDELILSQLAYVAFGDHIPAPEAGGDMPLHDAVTWLLDYDPEAEKIHQTGFMWKGNHQLLQALSGSRRFGGMRLSRYVDQVSEADGKQFAAMCVEVGDGTRLVAFRGTDDSLVGWKEDLSMVYECPVPAQEEAVRYLEATARATGEPLRVIGHSKGGNLAVFAASMCDDGAADRLLSIVSHDGPGQARATIESPGYARIRDRLRVYIPHFSFVGMLLEHESNYTIVQSDADTVLQHDAFSWQMQGTRMLYADSPDETSLNTNRIIREWIATLGEEQQKLFIDAVYEIAAANYGDKLPDDVVENPWPMSAQLVFSAVLNQDPKTRAVFHKSLGELFSTVIKNIRLPWHKQPDEEKYLEDVGL